MTSNFSRRHFLFLTVAFLVALSAAIFFGVRLLVHAVYWASHRNEPIEEWMWIGYVARSHGISPEKLQAALGLPPERRDRRTLGEIARQQNRSLEDIRALLEATIAGNNHGAAPDSAREP